MTERISAFSSYLAELREKEKLLLGKKEVRPRDLKEKVIENVKFLVSLAKPELKSFLDVYSDNVDFASHSLLYEIFSDFHPALTFHITEGKIYYTNEHMLYGDSHGYSHTIELLPVTVESLIRRDRRFFAFFGNLSKQEIVAKVIESVQARVKDEKLSSLNWTSSANTI